MSFINKLKANSRRRLKKQPSTRKNRNRNRQSHVPLAPESMEPRVFMTANAVADGGWNDPTTWENGILPDANTPAIISHGITVELDGIDHVAETIAVHGTLIVPEEAGATDPTEVVDGRMNLYFNGQHAGDAPASQLWDHSDMTGIGGVTGQTRTHMGIQRTGNRSGNFFDGQIDKVATYNRALDSNEVGVISSTDRSLADGVAEEDMATLWMFDSTGANLTPDTAPLDQKNDNGRLFGDAVTEGELSLDGERDYVKVDRSTDINRGVFTEKTISLWFKTDNTDGVQTLYEQGGGTRGLHVYLDGDTLYAGGWNLPQGESGWQGDWITQTGIVAGEWNHVVLTLDGVKTPDKTLSTRWMHVNGGGEFIVGSEADRYDEGTFTLELTGTDKDHDPIVPMRMLETGMVMPMQMTNNDGFLMTAGSGRVQLYGEEKLSFTKLHVTAEPTETSIVVSNVIERNFSKGTETSAEDDGELNWTEGDEIVIASSSFDYKEEEVRTITKVIDNGNGTTTLQFEDALEFRHYGEVEKYRQGTGVDGEVLEIDMRAEVALLSRNITIKGLESQDTDIKFGDRDLVELEVRDTDVGGLSDAEKSRLPDQQIANGVGGHVMFMPDSGDIVVDGVQLDGLGQASRKGRYPIHWHLGGDRSDDVFRNSSVTNSNNRGVTIHGTNNLSIEGVVVHDVHGHGFFFEDAVETGNELVGNLVLGVHAVGGQDFGFHQPGTKDPFVVDTHDSVTESRARFSSSAAYWITNPNNTFVGNIAAGGGDQREVDDLPENGLAKDKPDEAGTGFWYAIPRTAVGESSKKGSGFEEYRPIFEDFGTFDFNTSHTMAVGLNFDRGGDIEDANFNDEVDPSTVHLDSNYKPLDPDTGLVSRHYVNSFTNYKSHGAAVYHRGEANTIRYRDLRIADSYNGPWAVSETEFIDSLYVGHSLGNSEDKTVEVGGPRLYDGAGRHEGAHFAGFAAEAASTFQVEGSSFGPTMYHVFPNVSFESDGTYDHMAHAISDFSSQELGRGHNLASPQEWIKAAIDVDGTLTGPAGGGVGYSIVPNIDFLVDQNDVQPEGWDAYLTDDVYARVRVENLDDGSDVNLFSGNAEDPFIVFTSQDGDRLEVTNGQNLGNGSWTQVAAKADDEGPVKDDFTIEFGIDGVPEGGFVLNMKNQDGEWVRENAALSNRIDAARIVVKVASASNYTPEGIREVGSIDLLRNERSENVFFRDGAGGNLFLNTGISDSQDKITIRPTSGSLQTPIEARAVSFGSVIEAEDFDNGFDGIAFHDSDGNVDVQDGRVVDIKHGEWLEYTAKIGSGGHQVGVNFSSTEAGGEIVVLAARDNSSGYQREIGRISVENTGGETTTEWLDAVDLAFASGTESVIRLEFEAPGIDTIGNQPTFIAPTGIELDSFQFRAPQNQRAYLGMQRTVSATDGLTIKLPEYDEGGEGVAYSDTTPTNDTNSGFRTDEGVDTTPDLITNDVVAGEWLEFTTDVEAGNYNVTLNKAWGGGRVQLLIGTSNSATSFRSLGTFSFGQDGEEDELTLEDVNLDGEWTGSDLVIRVEILAGFMGLNNVQFTSLS